MRVLYFHQHFSTPKGSTGTRSYEMAKNLVLNGHQVTMVCGSYSLSSVENLVSVSSIRKEGDVDGIRVVQFQIPYANKQNFFQRIKAFGWFAIQSTKLIFTEKYDLVFTSSTPLTIAIPGIVAKFIRHKKFVLEIRDLWPELPKAMGVIKNPLLLFCIDLLESISYWSADQIIALSPGMKDGILKKVPNKHVEVIPNGSDLNLFSPRKNEKESCPYFNFKPNDFIAAFTGAHGIANGLDYLIEVAQRIQDSGQNHIKIVFIGDGAVKPHLQNEAQQRDLKNCCFLSPMSKYDLVQMFHFIDVGLMVLQNVPAFYYGTSPNKFFDYLSAGLPVINNYPGWLAEMIESYQIGKVVSPEKPEDMANCLVKLSHCPDEVFRLGQNARNLAEEKFDRQKLAQDFLIFLESASGSSDSLKPN